MAKVERFKEIDILRGLGIFFIIVVHTASYYLFDKTAFFLWNYSQFAVPIFVFCSCFLFLKKREEYTIGRFFFYAKKRLYRLLKPYYIFLLFYLPVVWVWDPKKANVFWTIKEATLTTGGTEINWAVLLFVFISLMMPPLLYLLQKRGAFFYFYVFLSLVSCILFLFVQLPLNFRLLMWLPWSLIILFSWFLVAYEKRQWFYPTTILVSGLVFLYLTYFLKSQGRSLIFIDNKYPPNLYFLSYGIFATTILYLLDKRGFFTVALLRRPINFLSQNSYSIFFIHLSLIVFTAAFFNVRVLLWWQFFLLVFTVTIVIQVALGVVGKAFVK